MKANVKNNESAISSEATAIKLQQYTYNNYTEGRAQHNPCRYFRQFARMSQYSVWESTSPREKKRSVDTYFGIAEFVNVRIVIILNMLQAQSKGKGGIWW